MATSEPAPKNVFCNFTILNFNTIGKVADNCSSAEAVKDIIKHRVTYESSCLKTMQKQRIVLSKIVEEKKSKYPVYKTYLERYLTDFDKGIALQQSVVSKLTGEKGPFETIKSWVDAPTTKKKPQQLHGLHYSVRMIHIKTRIKLRKEQTVLINIREKLAVCRRKLHQVQVAMNIERNLNVSISAANTREQKTLQGQEQDLIKCQDKSLQKYRALVMEETEIRYYLEKEMPKIATTLEAYNVQRLQISNAAVEQFSKILHQQQTLRKAKKKATLALLELASPGLLKLPQHSLMHERQNCSNYKFRDYGQELRNMGYSVDTFVPPVSETTNTVEESPSSTKPSSSQDTKESSTKPSSAKETKKSSTAPSSSDKSDVDSEDKPNRKLPTSPENKESEAEGQEKPKRKVVKKAEKQEEDAGTKEQGRKLPSGPDDNEEKPKRKLPTPPENKESEAERPPPVPQSGRSNDDSPQNGEQEKSAEKDVFPRLGYGAPLDEPRPLQAVVKHKATDFTYLNFKKGQKIVQTHWTTLEGIFYGYTRKHAFSRIKYGFFRIGETKPWKATVKNVLKNLFT